MRKLMMYSFALLAMMMMAMPAYAQGGSRRCTGRPTGSPLPPASASPLPPDWLAWARVGWVPRLAKPWPAILLRVQPFSWRLILGLAFIESLVLFTLVIIFAKVV